MKGKGDKLVRGAGGQEHIKGSKGLDGPRRAKGMIIGSRMEEEKDPWAPE